MDKPKHTPGPWRVVARHAAFGASRGITTVGSSTHGAVADCGGCSVSVAQDEANARLIAAAPELLDALQAFVDSRKRIGWGEGQCDLWLGPQWHKALDAIRKATGKE